jgi:hypothetical protein
MTERHVQLIGILVCGNIDTIMLSESGVEQVPNAPQLVVCSAPNVVVGHSSVNKSGMECHTIVPNYHGFWWPCNPYLEIHTIDNIAAQEFLGLVSIPK